MKPELGSRWRHYRGGHYIVLGFTRDEAREGALRIVYISDREFIAYTAGDAIPWDRPLDEWNGTTLPEGALLSVKRYELISVPAE